MRFNAPWNGNSAPRRAVKSRPDRLGRALEDGELPIPPSGTLGVLNARPGTAIAHLDRDRTICEQGFKPSVDALLTHGFRVKQRLDQPLAGAIVAIGRSREASLGAIARAARLVTPGGLIAVDGAKTDGIDAIARQVQGPLDLAGTFVKAHGRLIWAFRPDHLPEAFAGWEEAAAPSTTADGFVTVPGLFSADGPDPGSMLLARHLPGRLAGRVADLGAGWGWLAHAALGQAPEIARLDLIEAEAAALDAARANVADARANFLWADATALPAGPPNYDAIITNPPFHTGRAADPALGRAFIAAAARLLAPSGKLLLVANRQLPYEATIGAGFAETRVLEETPAYKVIEARRPRRA